MAEESSVSTPTEPFGHIILKEKLSTTYHQENDCNLIGPPDEISTNGSNSLYFSFAESSATSVQILTTVIESQVSDIESSLEKCESKLHEGDQSLSTCAGIQVQAEPEVSSKLARYPLDEHADSALQSIQENHSYTVEKSTAINRPEERPILQEENIAFVPRNPSLTNASSPTKVETDSTQRGTGIISPTPVGMSSSSATNSQSQRRLRGASLPFFALSDRPPSPTRYERRSWAESGRWSMGSELGLTSPHGGSYSGSTSSISPGPLSPVILTTERTSHSGKHFTSIVWPDVHDMLTKCNTEPNAETDALSCTETEQDDIEVAESTCRSTLICPYVAPADPNLRESPIHCPTKESIPNQGSKTALKTSYATTVNLQIAGSGRISSFSNAQVSLTQTLSPVAGSQSRRKVSINSCNFSMQNCKRLWVVCSWGLVWCLVLQRHFIWHLSM